MLRSMRTRSKNGDF